LVAYVGIGVCWGHGGSKEIEGLTRRFMQRAWVARVKQKAERGVIQVVVEYIEPGRTFHENEPAGFKSCKGESTIGDRIS